MQPLILVESVPLFLWCLFVCPVVSHVRLCDPIDRNPPGSSVRGTSQAKILEWAAISNSRGVWFVLVSVGSSRLSWCIEIWVKSKSWPIRVLHLHQYRYKGIDEHVIQIRAILRNFIGIIKKWHSSWSGNITERWCKSRAAGDNFSLRGKSKERNVQPKHGGSVLLFAMLQWVTFNCFHSMR